MATPESPSTPPINLPRASPVSNPGCSITCGCWRLVQALIEAAKRYEKQNAEALSNMENFDGLVEVEIPDGEYLSIGRLGEACGDAKRSTGKLKVVAFLKPAWTRFANGQDPQGNPVIICIPSTLLLAGAHTKGDNHAVIDIPVDALPANINLARLVSIYRD